MKKWIGISALAIMSVLAISALAAPPASAASLLGGALGGNTSTASNSVGVPGVATVSLNNASSGTQGNATALDGGGSTINVGLGNALGGNSSLGVTLPGTGNGSTDGTIGGVADTVNGLTDNGGTADTLLGSVGDTAGGLGGVTGGLGGTGTGGIGGAGGFFQLASGGDASGSGLVLCNGAAPQAISQLLQRQNYSTSALNNWRRASNVRIVPIKLCPAVRHNVSRAVAMNGNVGVMQSYAAADPLISASLSRARYGAGNVLAVDQSKGMLTVFVY